MLALVVGDFSGARVELRVPLQRQHAEIREGDEAGPGHSFPFSISTSKDTQPFCP